MSNQVDPSHYGGDLVMVLIERFGLNFARGNVVKYVSRAGRKAGQDEITELEKARWYLEREIARVKGQLAPITGIHEGSRDA